jgi:hypothetical protein
MPLIPLKIPPGVHRNGTDFEASNRWRDSNLVRWHDGSLRPVGGWQIRKTSAFASPPRAMLGWVDNTGGSNIAAGAWDKLYYFNSASAVTDITPTSLVTGDVDAAVNTGYGGGYFGGTIISTDPNSVYGRAQPSSGVYQEATTWALDTWGEYLLACSSKDGKIYEWTLNTSVIPTALANAPVNNVSMLVTEDRFVFALGAGGNPRKVAWCDREDNTVWSPLATNEAGDMELQTQGQIMCGVNIRGRTLILTDQDAHVATYSGPPFVYGFERAGTACGAVARRVISAVDEGAFWMGHKGFFTFNGSVAQEISCSVLDYVFDNINRNQISKVYAVHNAQHGEVWWFYPSGSSTENDKYVAFDYKEGHWSVGTLDRTSGIDIGVFSNPIWCDASGTVYNHETGTAHGVGDTYQPYAETGPISLGNGDKVMRVTSLIPDELIQGNVKVTFKSRFHPNTDETTHGPYSITSHHGVVPIRFTGRQVRMRIEGLHLSSWRAGIMRIEVSPGGKR